MRSSIDIVTHKQVAGGGGVASQLEQLQEVVVLPMHVTAHWKKGGEEFGEVGWGVGGAWC